MIDFLKVRYICAIYSVVLISSFVGLFIYRRATTQPPRAFEYSLEFTGGTEALYKFEKPATEPISTVKIRELLVAAGFPDVIVRDFPEQEVQVRIKEHKDDAKGLAERMREEIAKAYPDNEVRLLESSAVGESMGSVLRTKSIYAILLAILAMLIYIAVTFWSFSFGVGAVVALVHDALVMLGVCLLLNIEISMTVIGAIMAILGYSVNDTIVIFAQIRKNLRVMRGTSLYNLVNISLNQTLRRTTLTSFATALAVLAMLIFGGEALYSFALILLVGIVFGTYSSIYIASPVMMLLYKE